MTSILEEILVPLSLRDFKQQFYAKFPTSGQGKAQELTNLLTWETVQELLDAGHKDVLMVQGGKLERDPGPISYTEARKLYERGHTIVARHTERTHPQLKQLAKDFARRLGGYVDVQIYCTPGNEMGFGWHYDVEDVFAIQCSGSKEFSLRKNTVNPWPLLDTLPADLHYEKERSPLMFKCTLESSDWLYIPSGYWHQARSHGQPSMHMSVGIMPITAFDYLSALREEISKSLLWRQRLSEFELGEAELEQLGQKLAEDLGQQLRNPEKLKAFLNKSLDGR